MVKSFEYNSSFFGCSGLSFVLLITSIKLVAANELYAEATDPIEAEKIIAINNPINPWGKWSKINLRNT